MKLFVAEEESPALKRALEGRHVVASEVIEVEVVRAVRRVRPVAESEAKAFLGGMALMPVSDRVRELAIGVAPLNLRALDAIHLATALLVGGLDAFIAYDHRLVEAARSQGIEVVSPV